jgi:GNAT superfamily N-acetyltransferase
MEIRYISTHLDDSFGLDMFDCGKQGLNTWLRDRAKDAVAKRTAMVFILHEPASPIVVGYYALSAHLILADDLPRRLRRGMPDKLPAALLGKFALDRSLHGRGVGGHMLFDSYQRVLAASANVMTRYLVTDAIDEEAALFYEHYGFVRAPGFPSMRLVRKVSDIAADVDSWG